MDGSQLRSIVTDPALVAVVVISSCLSAIAAPDGDQHGSPTAGDLSLAGQLVGAGVPAVLAMRDSVTEGFATAFCGSVYVGLGRDGGGTLKAVSDVRRAACCMASDDDRIDPIEWATPVLVLSTNPVFPPSAPASERANDDKWAVARTRARDLLDLLAQPGYVPRTAAQRQVTNALTNDELSAFVVYGPPGVGKTALTARAAGHDGLIAGISVVRDPDSADDLLDAVARAIESAEGDPLGLMGQTTMLRDRAISWRERLRLLADQPATPYRRVAVIWDDAQRQMTTRPSGASMLAAPIHEFASRELEDFVRVVAEQKPRHFKLQLCSWHLPGRRGLGGPILQGLSLGPMSTREFASLSNELWGGLLAPELAEVFAQRIGYSPGAAIRLTELTADGIDLMEGVGQVQAELATQFGFARLWDHLDPMWRRAAVIAAVPRHPLPFEELLGRLAPDGWDDSENDDDAYSRYAALSEFTAAAPEAGRMDWDAANLSPVLRSHLSDDLGRFPWLALTTGGVQACFDGIFGAGLLTVHHSADDDAGAYRVMMPRWMATDVLRREPLHARDAHRRSMMFHLDRLNHL